MQLSLSHFFPLIYDCAYTTAEPLCGPLPGPEDDGEFSLELGIWNFCAVPR